MTYKKTILVWIDLETTGLDERRGRGEILEYAIVLTDLELNEIDSLQGVIAHDTEWIYDIMEDYALHMHAESGLLQEVIDASTQTDIFGREAVGQERIKIMGMLLRHKDPNTTFVIAGNSVSFDRRWLKEHMCEVEKILHYRQLDVSSYKVGFPDIFGTKTSEEHRAMADIRASIEQQRLMRQIVAEGRKALKV
jgi:oligoribonuclease